MTKAKVLSVTPKTYSNGTKTLYHVVTEDGKLYTCFSERIKSKIGMEVEFDVVEKEYNGEKQYTMNLPKDSNAPQNFFGGKKPFVASFKDSREAVILQAKSMVLSYCKDTVNKMVEIQLLTPEKAWQEIENGFKKLLPLLDLDSLPQTSQFKPQEGTGPLTVPSPPTLKASLVTILREKFKGWQNTSIVKFAGTEGVILPHDTASGDVYFERLSEGEANTLINAMSKD